MIIGVPGNCLILRVYWSKPRKTTTNLLIMGLAGADLATCLFTVYFIGPSLTVLLGEQPSEVFRYVRYILFSAVSSSVLITTVIALDRYDCVCRPHRRLLNQKKTLTVVLCLISFALAMNVPYIGIAADYTNAVQYTFVVRSIHTLSYIVTLTVITVCYWKVYKTIRKHVKVDIVHTPQNIELNLMGALTISSGKQNQNNITLLESITGTDAATSSAPFQSKPESQHYHTSESDQNRTVSTEQAGTDNTESRGRRAGVHRKLSNTTALQRKTTRMLLLASLVLLISWLPYWFYLVLVFAKYLGEDIPDHVINGFYHSSVVLYLNHAVNPLIYGLANRRFRQDCQRALSNLSCWRNNWFQRQQ
ncbi:5-hydroxytryptamine receptor 2B-like [Patiria miniata]|uniref:G-protein coupled receptors family 1 profile domain-containing protein n=1 Tax=Patiria miniata TaxID=46514 RepID=A0A913ZQI0_PATMI|nr:5-hydroxytryptamine receptor 2B-like [Patiria miniata]